VSTALRQTGDWQPELATALTTLPGNKLDWLAQRRAKALNQFVELGFPTRKTETWKYLATHAIAQITPALSQSAVVDSNQITQWRLDGCDEVVFVNGIFHAGLSSLPSDQNIAVKSLAELLVTAPEQAKELLAQIDQNKANDAFDALNQTLIRDGAVVTIADNGVIERPLHLLFVSTTTNNAITPVNNWISAGKNSQGTVIETYIGNDKANNLTLSRTTINAAENSQLNHYRCQRESKQAYHFAEMTVEQARSSRFSAHSIALGSAIARINMKIVLAGQGADCQLNGLYLTKDKQVSDHHIEMQHAVPHCRSDQLFKGVMDDQSRAIFNGRILVNKDAQKTEAYLTNRNLLLSKLADINTKPELEIYADDVKCSHGATIGQLDEHSLFYLQSRGISREQAEHLLIYAFINDVVDRITLDSLHEQIASLIIGRLPDSEFIREMV